ncbi:MAG TPA: saccharopine dehydrogenase NADP-binding domain-containing protein [Solirubrobacteraceae bacterium]|nr:saccharopine dehydrogenase NADP-binding domain-containing protein [Solirubrobacteraceae bacterium]
MSSGEHDIVLFGATGFTGSLTADYLANHAPTGTKIALAGRNRAKLESVAERLARPDLPLLHAAVEDPASLRAVAESARVVISTVGPYLLYGEPVVAACAAAGTDYVDLTGEPEFVDLMWLGYQAEAERTGARLVHCCGFDSIPHDLGTFFTVQQLPEDVPLRINGYVKVSGIFSGGTYQTAINALARARQSVRTASERRRLEARPADRRIKGIVGRPHLDAEAGGWVLPLPTIDPQVVLRSARALTRYGPDFGYGHYLVQKRLRTVAALAGGTGAALALAQLPPTRRLLLSFRHAGEGPTPEQREKSWFRVRFIGEGGGERVVTEVSGGDPGYGETAKMLSESALCLVHDELPELSGQLTTAVAMGPPLLERLQRAGIEFRQTAPSAQAP